MAIVSIAPGAASALLLAAALAAGGCRPLPSGAEAAAAAAPVPPGAAPAGPRGRGELSPAELAAAAYLAGQDAELAGLAEAAVECYRRALELVPEVAEFHARLGLALVGAGRGDQAAPHLEAAERLGSRSFGVLQSLAEHHLRGGRRERAVACFELMMSCPELAERDAVQEGAVLRLAYFLMGHYAGSARPGEAARVAAFLIGRFPDRPEFRLERARHLLSAGAEAQALEELEELARSMPASSAGERLLAAHYAGKLLHGPALAEVEKVLVKLRSDPAAVGADLVRMRHFRAELLTRLGRRDEARAELAALLAEARDDAERVEALVELTALDRADKRPAEAARRLQEALALGLEGARAWNALTGCLEDLGRPADAAEAARRAAEGLPDDPHLRARLARLLERLGRRAEAAAELRVALRVSPQDPECSSLLGYLYALEGIHLDEAAELVTVARRADPGDGRHLCAEGWVRYRQGRVKEALGLLESAALHAPGPQVYEHLGDACYALGLWGRARLAWRKSLELEPGRSTAVRRLERVKAEPAGRQDR